MQLPNSQALALLCKQDGEFNQAARFWTGTMVLEIGEHRLQLWLNNGEVSANDHGLLGDNISLSGEQETWAALLQATPARFMNDIYPLVELQLIKLQGEQLFFNQYYPAVMRLVELLRPASPEQDGARQIPAPAHGSFDGPVGRYINLHLQDDNYRIYFEEAGSGIPVLLQHTAGCHGVQFRHLFENPEITKHFHLIAYDLPYHGKSLPPSTSDWWQQPYQLTAEFVRSVPIALSKALGLDKPVFMGCSVGGVLALDLARYHPEEFSAVIALEGVLSVDMTDEMLQQLWHPQVSNEFKARLMNSLMSPTAPAVYRKETSHVYAAGWPPLFSGDLHYYGKEFDLTDEADKIDTTLLDVYILNGEYDTSGTVEGGKLAHEKIKGSHWTEMKGMGHFPMSEDPVRFNEYLMPILEQIRSKY